MNLNENQWNTLEQSNDSDNSHYPLLPLQKGLLFHSKKEAGLSCYLNQIVIGLHEQVRSHDLQFAIQSLTNRHDVLRSCIDELRLDLVIQKKLVIHLNEVDLSSTDDPLNPLQAWLDQDKATPFELSKPPLIRFHLIKLSENNFTFVVTYHHILMDGSSTLSLIKELFAVYDAVVGNKEPQVIQPLSYKQCLSALKSLEVQNATAYWTERFKGFEQPTRFPQIDVKSETAARMKQQTFKLNNSIYENLKALAKQQKTTLAVLLQAGWALLLAHYCNTEEVVFGVTRSFPRRDTKNTLGLFINTLPVRLQCQKNKTLEDLMTELKQQHRAQLRQIGTPLATIQAAVQLPQNTALFSTLFDFKSFGPNRIKKKLGKQWKSRTVDFRFDTHYPLLIESYEEDEGLLINLHFNSTLFDKTFIHPFMKHYEHLLGQFPRSLQQSALEIPLLTAEEQQELKQWNDTEAPYPEQETIPSLFSKQARLSPDRIAASHQTHCLTYRELEEQSNRLAHYLKDQGIKAGTPVLLYVERNVSLLIGLLGILKSGGYYVPIDPGYPPHRIATILKACRSRYVLTQTTFLENTHRLLEQFSLHAQVIALDNDGSNSQDDNKSCALNAASASDTVYALFTSGSTGEPKGVANSHRALVNRLLWMQEQYSLTEEDRVLHKTSIGFDVSFWELFWPLLTGAQVVLAPPGAEKENEALIQVIHQTNVTRLHFVPSALQTFLSVLSSKGCPSLQQVICSGEVLTTQLADAFFKQLPGVKLSNLYGPTEAAIDVTYWDCQPNYDNEERKTIPIGRPIANTRLYVVNRHGQIVGKFLPGELCIAGVGLAEGYLNQPELTQEKFVETECLGARERLYKTGDVVRWLPEGQLDYLWRVDGQIKLRGFRIELGEIEQTVAQFPLVQNASAAVYGEGLNRHIVVYFTATEPVDPETIRRFLSERLPTYMIPAHFQQISRFPLTQHGKIDKSALSCLAPSSPSSRKTLLKQDGNETEKTVYEACRQFLNVPESSPLYKEDNFFNLGGNSLTAIQVAAYLNNALLLSITPTTLFDYPVLGELIERIGRLPRNSLTTEHALMAVKPGQPRPEKIPLSFAQQRLWFLDQLYPNQTSYNVFVALKITGELDVPVFQSACEALLQRHEILRTTFSNKAGTVFQVIHDSIPSALKLHQANDLNPEEVYKTIYTEAQTPFNLEKGPLIRMNLLIRDHQEYLFVMTLHHIVCDGWSISLLGKELSSLYTAIKENRAAEIAPPEIQYADYASALRTQLTDHWLAPQINYWKTQLLQAPRLNFPTDHPRPSVQEFKGKHVPFHLEAALSDRVKSLATRHNTTLFNVLLSAFVVTLARYSNQQEIVLGTPIAGRHYPGTENLLGLFVNALVLRSSIDTNDSFIEVVKKNHSMLKSAYANQDVPFEKLVEHLVPNREMNRHPFYQIMIVMQNFDLHGLDLPGVQIERVFNDNDTLLLSDFESSQLDLTLYLQEKQGTISGLFEYTLSLFKEETIARFSRHFLHLISQLTQYPDAPVLSFPLISPEEHQQLVEWNQTDQEYSPHRNVVQLFEEQVAKGPDQTAVVLKDSAITYRTLNESANQLAHYLRLKAVPVNALIGVYLDRSIEMVVSLLAVWKAGAAYLPIDSEIPPARLRYLVDDSKMHFILTNKRYQQTLETVLNTSANLLVLEEIEADCRSLSSSNVAHTIHPEDFSYVIYTSGSTGKPKGVVNQHKGTFNRLAWMQAAYPLNAEDRVLQKTPLSFDVSVWEIFWPLTVGAVLVLSEPELHKDVNYLVDLIQHQRITVVHFVPSLLSLFLEQNATEQLTTLRHVFVSGEKFTSKLQQHCFDSLPPSVALHNLYGPTEASIDASYWDCVPDRSVVPIGKPIANTKIYITDPQRNLTPVGIPGEICIAGEGVAWGYLNQPQLTREKFVANPFDSGRYAQLYRTGDLGRWMPEGTIEYIDRIDWQIKMRGFRIEPAEIEAALLEHGSIKQAAVIPESGTYSQQLRAYLVIEKEQSVPDFEALFQFLKQFLPSYMIPSSFLVVENMPLTQTGKIDRHQLPFSKIMTTIACSQELAAVTDPVQKKLRAIWMHYLNLSEDRIGIHQDFFELGGHSLLALKIISALQTEFGVTVNTRDFFQSPTIAQLSQLIKQKGLEQALHKNNLTYITQPHSPLITLQPEGNETPLFLFHPVGGTVFCYMPLVSYLRKDRPCYALQDPGIEARQPLYKTLKEMALDYSRIVKTVQPEGPYMLGGSSFGGTIAVEIAHQLIQAGEEVAFLPLFDSWALFTDEFRSRQRLETCVLRQFNMLKQRLNTENVPDPEPWLELNWHRMNLWLNYRPSVVDTTLTVFKAKELLPEYLPIDDAANHWQAYSTYPVETFLVPGDHETIHLEPNVRILAHKMQQCLDSRESNAILRKFSFRLKIKQSGHPLKGLL